MIETFATSDLAADTAAEAIVAQLTPPGPKRLVVTGGRSPGPVYDRLAAIDLEWSRITVTLSDDRFVGADSPESNERLVRERLLQGRSAAARFIPLKGAGPTPAADAAAAEPAVQALRPFDAVLLGMGEDGHIASLFPNDPGLAAALDLAGDRAVVGVARAGLAPYVPRISLTLATLLDSRLVVVLTSGEARRALIERAAADLAAGPPVAALLRQTKTPVRVIWSP
ncbi:MAG TPA: 6-phosphogluconolactonase [Caulobacteraceae bacterium]|nr:6-phosphogluconolactonase [Caulobacteraceae bacterium]